MDLKQLPYATEQIHFGNEESGLPMNPRIVPRLLTCGQVVKKYYLWG